MNYINQSTILLRNLLVTLKINKKRPQKSLFPPLCLRYELQLIFLTDVTFSSWPDKFVNPIFLQY